LQVKRNKEPTKACKFNSAINGIEVE